MADFSAKRLGKLPAKLDDRRLKLKHYVLETAEPLPEHVDWTKGRSDWGELGNDVLGDCTIAGIAHAIQVWRKNNSYAADDESVSTETVIKYYSEWCGFNPSDANNTDNGGIEVDVLNKWRKENFAGHRLIGYADPELLNREHIKRAIYELGGVYIGLQLPLTAQTQSRWEVVGDITMNGSQPGSWGGHAVYCPGYSKQDVTCISWGEEIKMSWQFFETYVDEAHALFGDAWLKNTEAPNGLNTNQLLTDLVSLGNAQIEETPTVSRIIKISGNFANVGDVTALTVPAQSHTVALRLYEETQEVAIFYMTDAPAQFASQGTGIVAQDTVRAFRAIQPESLLPNNFVKFVGAMGLRVPHMTGGVADPILKDIVQVHIIEESIGG